ncbi:hypothetical protein HanRHA438_Chr03g0107731 [Helianthus annuus]|nr:hypothetical protein HanRHA438_Chr03g0107731 [Helianthus annuus]
MFKGFFHFVRINLVNDLHSCGGLIYSFLVPSSNRLQTSEHPYFILCSMVAEETRPTATGPGTKMGRLLHSTKEV